jgi:hypothetical protein
MTKIKWREVFKFLSGAALAGSFVNVYLWLSGVSVPFLGYTITPRLLGVREKITQLALAARMDPKSAAETRSPYGG